MIIQFGPGPAYAGRGAYKTPSDVLVCDPAEHEFVGTLAIGRDRPPVHCRSSLVADAVKVIAQMPEVIKLSGRLPTIWYKDDLDNHIAFSADLIVKVSTLTPGLKSLDVTDTRFYVSLVQSLTSGALQDQMSYGIAMWREVMGPLRHVVLTRHDLDAHSGEYFA